MPTLISIILSYLKLSLVISQDIVDIALNVKLLDGSREVTDHQILMNTFDL